MCGIIAVVRRPSDRRPPELAELLAAVEGAAMLVPAAGGGDGAEGWDAAASLAEAAKALSDVDQRLRGIPGLRCLLADPEGRARLDGLAAELERRVDRLEAGIDAEASSLTAEAVEAVNAALGVSAPASRLPLDSVKTIAKPLLETAAQLVADLGGDV